MPAPVLQPLLDSPALPRLVETLQDAFGEGTVGATLESQVVAGFAIPTLALFDAAAQLAALRAVLG